MQPFLSRSDFDPFQVTVIVIFVLASFVKWLWENWQARRGSTDDEIIPPDPEVERLREAAWRRQTGQGAPPPLPPPVAASPWQEMKKVWEELQDAARGEAAPKPVRRAVRPPPMPTAAPEPSPAAKVAAVPVAARAAPRHEAAPSKPKSGPSQMLVTLRRMGGDPALLRQAVLMHEILGPPKALQSSDDPAI